MTLTYVTSNKDKIKVAQQYLKPLGIDINSSHLELEEIQSISGEEIIKKKAEQAFLTLKEPLIVSDHFWNIRALNGFPGAYMKQMNQWFKPQDFLNLMKDYQNRTVFLEEYLCFINETRHKIFFQSTKGTMLRTASGDKHAPPAHQVISLRADQKSVAQSIDENVHPADASPLWKEFAQWYKNTKS